MARTTLAVQTTTRSGIQPTFSAATADGHAFNNDGQMVYLHVKNGSGVSTTVTLDRVISVDGDVLTDRTVTVNASEEKVIGPFGNDVYGQVNSTLGIRQAVHVNASPQASVTYAAIKLGPK